MSDPDREARGQASDGGTAPTAAAAGRGGASSPPEGDPAFDARVRAALGAGGIGLWDWDVLADRVAWSDEVLRIFGVTRERFDGTYAAYLAMILPEDRSRMEQVIRDAAARLGSFSVEHRIVLPSGEERWLMCMGRAMGTAEGEVRHMTGVVLDTTDRRRAERQLLLSNRQLEEAQRIARMGSFEWRRTPERVWTSRETYRILGMDADASYVPPLAFYGERVHPDDRERVVRTLLAGASHDFAVEHRIVRADDGAIRFVRLEGRVERGADGKVTGGFGTVHDVTDEMERERSRKELEHRLDRSRKFEALGQLAGGIAHDFNNLLTAILGNVTLIRRRAGKQWGRYEADWVEEGLAQIEEASHRAGDLTRQLLAFGRRQVGRAEPVDLNVHLRSMEDMLRRLVGEHLHLELDLSDSPAVVRIDTSQLEQVILNLAINARDAMPGGGLLSIGTVGGASDPARAESNGKDQPMVVLRVQDTGAGMSPEVLERIFEPFFTTKEPGKGTGLGLSTVYGVVQQAGGRCEVRSSPGRGSIFEVWLPATSEPIAAREEGERNRLVGGSEVVLVCEDDPQVLEVTSGILRASGYRVVTAVDGEEALRLVDEAETAFDIIVSDVVTPHLGGRELARRLRDRGSPIPFVFVSGYVPDAPERDAAPLPWPLLQKPFTAEELLGTVRRMLDALPGTSTPPSAPT